MRTKRGIRPVAILPLGFLGLILVGTVLLSLPIATVDRTSIGVFDAWFTATSASCITGLIVTDTAVTFSMFGQVVIIMLIQCGGLGFMTMATLLFLSIRKRISLKERLTIAESLGENKLSGIVRLGRNAAIITFGCELIGAALLSIRFIPMLGWSKGIWYSVFHSISAFCNAGFDLMGRVTGEYSSFTALHGDLLVNLTLIGLIIIGGLGFAVIMDLGAFRRTRHLSLHTKLVLFTTLVLLFAGALLFFILEYDNTGTMQGMSVGEKALASLFQSVTCRTAGFNTVDQAALTDSSKLLSSILMFIGGAPAGTAGGIKVTTVALLALTLRSFLRGHSDVNVFRRRVSQALVQRSLCIFIVGILMLMSASMIVSFSQIGVRSSFIDVFFELASAVGTVGVSTGVTAEATAMTRVVLCLFMFAGRVGPLTLVLSLSGKSDDSTLRYPEGSIMVG